MDLTRFNLMSSLCIPQYKDPLVNFENIEDPFDLKMGKVQTSSQNLSNSR